MASRAERFAGVVVSADPAADPVARATALSFRDVYRDHFAFVWRMTRRLGVAHSSVDDVVQDVFVVLHRRLPEYDGRVPVRTWLFGILSFVVRDHRRRFRRKDARCVPPPRDSQSDIALPSADMSPAARAEHAERVALLRHLLDALDDAKRELLVLAYLEQMTVPEIAELLGLNLNTAYSRLRAAKQAFDQLYAAEQARAKRGEP